MAMSSLVRTFVALPLSRRAAEGFTALQKRLAGTSAHVRWTPPAQFHITLKFLGDVDQRAIPKVIEAVRSAVGSRGALTLSFQGVGAFPDWKRPRVLWSRVADGAGDVVRLARAVHASLAWISPQSREREFVPHVTLGRVKAQGSSALLFNAAKECSRTRVGPEVVGRVVVYESRLLAQGAVHRELESIPLTVADR